MPIKNSDLNLFEESFHYPNILHLSARFEEINILGVYSCKCDGSLLVFFFGFCVLVCFVLCRSGMTSS